MVIDEVTLLEVEEQDNINTIYVGQNSVKIELALQLGQQFKTHAKIFT
jgi:plasmid maintenance system antidote protein VapI